MQLGTRRPDDLRAPRRYRGPVVWPANREPVSTEFKRLRPIVWARDGGACQWPLSIGVCGKPGGPVDHVIPRYRGGQDILSNLQVLCSRHHNRKTQTEAAEARQRKRTP